MKLIRIYRNRIRGNIPKHTRKINAIFWFWEQPEAVHLILAQCHLKPNSHMKSPSPLCVHVNVTLGGLRRGASDTKGKLGLVGHVKALGSDESQTWRENNVLPLSLLHSFQFMNFLHLISLIYECISYTQICLSSKLMRYH